MELVEDQPPETWQLQILRQVIVDRQISPRATTDQTVIEWPDIEATFPDEPEAIAKTNR
jgi:hypothetical protein